MRVSTSYDYGHAQIEYPPPPPFARLPVRLAPSYYFQVFIELLCSLKLGGGRIGKDPLSKAHAAACLVSPSLAGPI